MTFKQYIASRKITHSFAGDFTGDARDDAEFPDVTSWDELFRYLKWCGACANAITGARSVWRSYQRSEQRRLPT